MSRAIVAIVLAVLLLGGGITELLLVNRTFDRLEQSVQQIYDKMEDTKENIDTEEIISMSESLQNYWRKAEKNLQMVISQIMINDLSVRIISLCRHIEQNDYDMANTVAAVILDNLLSIRRVYEPRIQNII